MKNCIIGYSGLVGKNLNRNNCDLYNSKNIDNIIGTSYDTIYIAAPNADKWLINKDPQNDLNNINHILNLLKKFTFKKIILISSIDIYDDLNLHDEDYIPNTNHPYGYNRYYFENEIMKYDDYHIIRLPGLFGNGLKKNIIFDICNNNFYKKFNIYDEYQWYNLENLNNDIQKVIDNNIKLINFLSEKISNKEILDIINNEDLYQHFINEKTISYNLKTKYENIIFYKKDNILNSIKNFYNDYK